MYVYIYIYIYILCEGDVCVYIYIYICRERDIDVLHYVVLYYIMLYCSLVIRKGTHGVSTNGVTERNIFFDRGTLVIPVNLLLSSKRCQPVSPI